MRRHINIVAWIHIAYGVVAVLGALALAGLMGSFGAAVSREANNPDLVALGTSGVAIGLGLIGALSLLGGWGLLKRQPWARTLVLVMSFLLLLGFPIGTAIGGYCIWVLMNAETRRIFAGGESSPPMYP